MTSGPPPACLYCSHLDTDLSRGWRCRAYPDGVPRAILRDGVDHFAPRPGDHGIQFAADRPEWRAEAERRWREDRESVEFFRDLGRKGGAAPS